MDHADAALPGQGDGHAGFRHRIHGRAHHRDVQRNLFCQLGVQIHIRRKHVALRRDQKHIVEGEAGLYKLFVPSKLGHIPLLHFTLFLDFIYCTLWLGHCQAQPTTTSFFGTFAQEN